MISKELLSEIMDDKVKSIKIMNDIIFVYFENNNQEYFISIYKLAHKCKVWAYKQGYVILSGHSAYSIGLFFCSCKGWLSENYDKQIEINHKTETEAIFQACQWILDNKI